MAAPDNKFGFILRLLCQNSNAKTANVILATAAG